MYEMKDFQTQEDKKEITNLQKEKEKLQVSAKAEARRIINERSAEAEELLKELHQVLLHREGLQEHP